MPPNYQLHNSATIRKMKCQSFCIESLKLDDQRATVHDLNTKLLSVSMINSIQLIIFETEIHE